MKGKTVKVALINILKDLEYPPLTLVYLGIYLKNITKYMSRSFRYSNKFGMYLVY